MAAFNVFVGCGCIVIILWLVIGRNVIVPCFALKIVRTLVLIYRRCILVLIPLVAILIIELVRPPFIFITVVAILRIRTS